MTPFATGAVVRLRSGGPNMLVVRCDDHGVHCVWIWEPPGELHPRMNSDAFPAGTLEEVLPAGRSEEQLP